MQSSNATLYNNKIALLHHASTNHYVQVMPFKNL